MYGVFSEHFPVFFSYIPYLPEDLLQHGYIGMETTGVDNNCLFESASIILWGNIKHVQFLRLATSLTGLKLLEQKKQEVIFLY